MTQSQRLPHCRIVGQLRLPSGAEKSKHVIACMRERQCHRLLNFVRACNHPASPSSQSTPRALTQRHTKPRPRSTL